MKVGDIFEEELLFNYEDMEKFLDIVKDVNPLHRKQEDSQFCDKNNRVIVQGMFALCMFSGLLSKYFPDSLNMSRKATFIRPLYLDEKYKIILKIKEIDQELGQAILKGYIKNAETGKTYIDCDTEIKNKILFGYGNK